MTWLGEIGKIYRDSVENLRENMNLRSKFCVCVSILDAATDLSGCSQSGSLSSEPKRKSNFALTFQINVHLILHQPIYA